MASTGKDHGRVCHRPQRGTGRYHAGLGVFVFCVTSPKAILPVFLESSSGLGEERERQGRSDAGSSNSRAENKCRPLSFCHAILPICTAGETVIEKKRCDATENDPGREAGGGLPCSPGTQSRTHGGAGRQTRQKKGREPREPALRGPRPARRGEEERGFP